MEHVSTYTAPMFITCPHCNAQPFQPCMNGARELRYTHTERNR
jgi:hypothetical protein